LPSARERKTRAEADLVQMFVEASRTRSIHTEDLALARRLLTHESADRVIATLLRDHLGARPDAPEEATAARRAKAPSPAPEPERAKPVAPAPAPAPRAERPREERPREAREERPREERPREAREERPREERPREERPREAREERPRDARVERVERVERPREERPRLDAPRQDRSVPETALEERPREERRPRRLREERPSERRAEEHRTLESARVELPAPLRKEPPPPEVVQPSSQPEGTADADADPIREIFVNVGRRDGAKPSDFQSLLEKHGITGEPDYIRVRHSHAFVGVRGELIERAVAALNGAQIAGQVASAELARRR
jgi:hypothetical protein